MTLLKADFHIHTSEDPKDYIKYSAYELIDMAHDLGYQVLSITNHDKCTWTPYLNDYAKERGILLIPGMEATIQGKHVLLINLPFDQLSVSKIKDLYRIPRETGLIVAPHPYFPSPVALGKHFTKNLDLFDAAEWSHFFCKSINFNKPMERIAQKSGITILGTSDAHQRRQFHTTYSLIEADMEIHSVIEAIKQGKVRVETRPLALTELFKINTIMLYRNLFYKKLRLFEPEDFHKPSVTRSAKG